MTGPTNNTKRALYNILTYVRLCKSDRRKSDHGTSVTRLAFGPFGLLTAENVDSFFTFCRHDSWRRLPKRDGRNAIKLCYFYRVSVFALPSAGCVPRLSQQYQDLARRYRPMPQIQRQQGTAVSTRACRSCYKSHGDKHVPANIPLFRPFFRFPCALTCRCDDFARALGCFGSAA